MSDTPRTDAAYTASTGAGIYELFQESKDIERELNAANDRIKRLEKDSERLHWLLKRGLAWRGCYNGHWLEGEWLYSSQYAIATIDKAKEAKP
jgi:aminoglycoside phosphotransferase